MMIASFVLLDVLLCIGIAVSLQWITAHRRDIR